MSFEQQLISWRRELHQYHPELSLQEVATTARIRDWLESARPAGAALRAENRPGRRSGRSGEKIVSPCVQIRCASTLRPPACRIARKTKG